jgi:hypothetical protein|nr:phage tail tube protein [uncultured Mediterranean phage uvMED]|tara:strand:- start:2240 stop:2860 length:621 start_codon:yes stop_codon:yes gene_type:complete
MPINQQNPPKTANRTIDKFKSRISGGIARPNLFEVVLATPDGVVDTDVNDFGIKSRFLVKAAALPASNIAPISVPFRGRTLKIAGDRTFDEWTVTVINDTDFAIRSSMERWMNSIAKVSDNSGLTNPEDYIKDLKIYQLGRAEVAQNTQASETDMPILRTYKFHGCFPTNVSQLDLSYDQADALEEFTVTFQVQWWEADGNGGSVY